VNVEKKSNEARQTRGGCLHIGYSIA